VSDLVQNPISKFLLDKLEKSFHSSLELYENFVFNYLMVQSNFKFVFSILFSAFQQDLLAPPENYISQNGGKKVKFPDQLEYVILTFEQYQTIASKLTDSEEIQIKYNDLEKHKIEARTSITNG
jgi:hypothetical protein